MTIVTAAAVSAVEQLPERLRDKIRFSAGCWTWTGATSFGYGKVAVALRRKAWVHRLVYELIVGPIPAGLQLDHLCRNRACCNPSHLEPVTLQENVRRGLAGHGARGRSTAQTHCVHGHEYTPENTLRTAAGRYCRTCNRDRARARRLRLAGVAGAAR